MLDELAQAQQLARHAEVLLDRIVLGDLGLRVVGAVQVPRVEARPVLQRAQELVATDYARGLRISFRMTRTCMGGRVYVPVVATNFR